MVVHCELAGEAVFDAGAGEFESAEGAAADFLGDVSG